MEKKIFDTDHGSILVTNDQQHETLLISGPTGTCHIPYNKLFCEPPKVSKRELWIVVVLSSVISSITMLCLL